MKFMVFMLPVYLEYEQHIENISNNRGSYGLHAACLLRI
jgi:hypothetical protein